MKKFLVLLVFGMASVAWAVPSFRVDPADAKDHYMPSDIITIQIVDNNPINNLGFMVDSITDNTGGDPIGTAAEPQLFNSTYKFDYPGVLNDFGQLVVWAAGSAGNALPNTMLYSFEYHVPIVPASTYIEIQSDWDDVDFFIPKFDYVNSTSYIGAVTPLVIHVIPEPATIALLGLGGLLLKRRK